MTAPRHFLVIATQCASEARLPRLDHAAGELSTTIAAPDLGAARGTVLRGADRAEVEAAVRDAVATADDAGAVLVLAFLGHGFSPDNATLYYMARDSVRDKPTSAVELGGLLSDAAQHPGLEGVIALVDTCQAASVVPDLRRVTAGVAKGRTGLDVLMSSAANQLSYDMDFTFALTGIIRAGISGAGEEIYVNEKLTDLLRRTLTKQTVARNNFDGDTTPGTLWLTRNPQHTSWNTLGAVGALGREQLRAAIASWQPDYPRPDTWTVWSVEELRSAATRSEQPAARHVVRVANAVILALRAATFIGDDLGGALTTPALRKAGRRARVFSGTRLFGAALAVALLEEAALRTATVDGNPWEPLTTFMAALTSEMGLPPDHGGLRAWARACGVDMELNDAFAALGDVPDRAKLHLVLAPLNNLTSGWPKGLRAWLLRPDTVPTPQEQFPYSHATRAGTEEAMLDAIDWATEQLLPGESLHCVDIAMPSDVLSEWCPEKVDNGSFYLGVHHDVLTQWSGRLGSGRRHRSMYRAACEAAQRIDNDENTPVDWVTREDLRDLVTFGEKLKSGGFRRAIGLDHRPVNLPDVLDLLLRYTPILLWPSHEAGDDPAWPHEVEQQWDALPAEFAEAFRTQTRNGHTTRLASVRVAWHNLQWLEFCRWFDQRKTRSP